MEPSIFQMGWLVQGNFQGQVVIQASLVDPSQTHLLEDLDFMQQIHFQSLCNIPGASSHPSQSIVGGTLRYKKN